MSGTRAPKTIVVYDITGQTDYTIPFEYLARKFVVVTLIGQDRKVLTLNTDYRFTTKTTIGLSDPSPVGYDKIEIRRFTSATDRLVDFHDGSILRAYDLNLSQIQTLHVAEEARDLAGDSIAVDDNGDLDARGRKIVNLADAENDTDAVNYGMLKKFDNSTFNNAKRAEDSANAAKVSENKAKNSELRSIEAEAKCLSSAGTAMTAAADANRSKEAAEDAEQVVVPLVPIVEKASQDAAKAAADAAQAVQDVKDLGAVPIGSIFPFVKTPPAGYLTCDGSTFSKDEYPDLYAYLGSTTLPDMRGRYLKMPSDLANIYQKFPAIIPALLHDVDISHTHTASQQAHAHDRGTMEIGGEFFVGSGRGLYIATGAYGGAFFSDSPGGADNHGGGASGGLNRRWVFRASRNWTGLTSYSAPAITVNALTNAIRQTTNMRLQNSNPDIQIGSALEVKHMTVVYAIKAAGKVADEGLMEVTQIKKDFAERLPRGDSVYDNRTWVKIAQVAGSSSSAGDFINFQVSGGHDFGSSIGAFSAYVMMQERNNTLTMKITQLSSGLSNPEFYTRKIDEFKYELWMKRTTTFPSPITINRLNMSRYSDTDAKIFEVTSTQPSGVLTKVDVIEQDVLLKKIQEYPTEWSAVEPETGSSSSVRWIRAGVWGDNVGETKWRYLDGKTIEVVGIIRVKSFQSANTYNVLKLPTGKTLSSLGNFFQPVQGNHVNLIPSYAEGSLNSDIISIISTADTDLGTFFFINWTIPLN
ncbi:tail fiber protein [Vibrio phage VP3]|uniref:Tail fiber protein n=1 Tax=Vibrio phage VP3 TaxID=588068 RepID=B8XCQ2_9CAUD|nr:tail fiber protein [Vibrio phage VP3]AFH14444.1 tail fiber protein [Vibrio phage VP3]